MNRHIDFLKVMNEDFSISLISEVIGEFKQVVNNFYAVYVITKIDKEGQCALYRIKDSWVSQVTEYFEDDDVLVTYF